MSDYVWTADEIRSCPMFGNDTGWFYGMVAEGDRHKLCEIFPGVGYTSAWPLKPAELESARQDVQWTPLRKARYVGARSVEQQEREWRELTDAPLEELRDLD